MKDNSWNSVAEIYHSQVGETGDFNHATYLNPVVLKILGDVKGKSVLDLACGQGYFSRILAEQGAKVVGVDIADKLIAIAKEREKKKSLGIKYYVKDSAKLNGLPKSQFDYVVSNVSFHDIRNISKTIKECARVIKGGGKVIFSILHPIQDIAEEKKDKEGFYIKVRNYLSQVSSKHFMKNILGNDIFIYHRSVGFYLQEFLKNNFYISDFEEINMRHRKGRLITDEKLLRFKQEIPAFLIVGAIKIK